MSRRAGIRYSESSEDEDYEYSRSDDGQRRYYYSDREEQYLHPEAKLVRTLKTVPYVTATPTLRPPHSTTASREPAGSRRSYSSDEESGKNDRLIEAYGRMIDSYENDIPDNGRTYAVNGNEIRLDRKYAGGYNRLGHSTASKLRRQGPGTLSDVCNKDTISKDNTVGNQAQMDELLASFGKKVFGMHCHELREESSPHTEPIYSCKYCLKTFDTQMEEGRHVVFLWPSDPSRERCKTWEEYYDEKNSNSQRRQRQQLAQDEYGDEADADLRDESPLLMTKEYQDKANFAFDYIQASKSRMAKDKYAKVVKDWEEDDDSSHSEDGAESEELSDYEYERPATGRSRERRIPAARLS